MDIRADDVKALIPWAANQFGEWLRRGQLDEVRGINPSSRWEPEPPLYLIDPLRPALDQLEEIYHLLPAKLQDAFAEGIGVAASALPNTALGVECFRELALLTSLVGSNRPIKAMIAKLDDPAFLAAVDQRRQADVFAFLFNVLAGLPTHPGSVELLHDLIQSARFEDAYVPMAFDALVRLQSGRIVDHLECLGGRFEWTDPDRETLERLADSIETQVGLVSLRDQLEGLNEGFPLVFSNVLERLWIEREGLKTFQRFRRRRRPRIEISSWLMSQSTRLRRALAAWEAQCAIVALRTPQPAQWANYPALATPPLLPALLSRVRVPADIN